MKYIIKDWAGNHMFKDKVFNSSEEASDFLINEFPNDDDDLGEYFVTPKK